MKHAHHSQYCFEPDETAAKWHEREENYDFGSRDLSGSYSSAGGYGYGTCSHDLLGAYSYGSCEAPTAMLLI